MQQIYGGETTRLVQLALGAELFDGTLDVVGGTPERARRLRRVAALLQRAEPGVLRQSAEHPGRRQHLELSEHGVGSARPLGAGERVVRDGRRRTTRAPTFAQNRFHGVDFSIRHDSGVIGIGEVGVHPAPHRTDGLFTSLPGDYKVGGYWDTEPLTDFATGEHERGTGGCLPGVRSDAVARARLHARSGALPVGRLPLGAVGA